MKNLELKLKGSLTLERAGELMQIMNHAIHENDQLTVSFDDIEEVDLSFLQLVCALYNTSANLGKSLVLAGEIPDIVRNGVITSGFLHCGNLGQHEDCLWREITIGANDGKAEVKD